jgi:hypothetical protein
VTSTLSCSNCGAPAREGLSTCHYCHGVLGDAIRLYREATKSSLREAKDFVEALEKKLGRG